MWERFWFLAVKVSASHVLLFYMEFETGDYHLCCTKCVWNSGLTAGGVGCLNSEEYSTSEEGKDGQLAAAAVAEARSAMLEIYMVMVLTRKM